MTGPGPAFSVIIPVVHGGEFLRKALDSLAGIDPPDGGLEALVSGGEGEDESAGAAGGAACRAGFPVRYLAAPSQSRADRLNIACAEARGRVLAFADDDCVFPPDWLRRFEVAFRECPGAGAVGGSDILLDRGLLLAAAVDRALRSPLVTGHRFRREEAGPIAYYPKLFNMAVSREIALEAARPSASGSPEIFDPGLDVYEDVDLGRRIARTGRRLVFRPEVRVHHFRDATFREFVAYNFRLGRAARKLGVHRAAQTALAALVAGGLGLAVMATTGPGMRRLFAAVVALYFVPLAIEGFRAVLSTRRLPLLVLTPAVIAALHVSRGLGFFFHPPRREVLSRRGRPSLGRRFRAM